MKKIEKNNFFREADLEDFEDPIVKINTVVPLMKCIQFAAYKHRHQRRMGKEETPYINHPINVATILAVEGHIEDQTVLMAALLHDTVEDTDTTFEEIEQEFGKEICDIVREVTCNKMLFKKERKIQQVIQARSTSYNGKLVKLADKLDNLRDFQRELPVEWTKEHVNEYFSWAKKVVDNLRGTNKHLERLIDDIFRERGLIKL